MNDLFDYYTITLVTELTKITWFTQNLYYSILIFFSEASRGWDSVLPERVGPKDSFWLKTRKHSQLLLNQDHTEEGVEELMFCLFYLLTKEVRWDYTWSEPLLLPEFSTETNLKYFPKDKFIPPHYQPTNPWIIFYDCFEYHYLPVCQWPEEFQILT